MQRELLTPGPPRGQTAVFLTSQEKQLDSHEGVKGDAFCQQDSQAQRGHEQHVRSPCFETCFKEKEMRGGRVGLREQHKKENAHIVAGRGQQEQSRR